MAEVIDEGVDPIITQTYNELIHGSSEMSSPGSQPPGAPIIATPAIVAVAADYRSPNFVPGLSGWELGSNGVIEAVGVILSGNISAVTGSIGGFTIDAISISTGAFDTEDTLYFGSSGLSLSDTFKVTAAGALTATSGVIGPWNISSAALSTGAFDTNGTMYFGTSGLSLSDVFKVTSAGVLTASSGVIGGFTITATELYGGIIKTAATVAAGSNGVIMDSAGLRGYDSVLGKVFDIHTDGSAPEFAFGNISNSIFEINTNAILRTSATVGDGSASSAGILINDTGLYATEANQTLANANVKILIDGSATIKMNVKGGQTDYNTGTGYFLGLSAGDFKFSIGDQSTNYMTWDGTYLRLKGSFDVGDGGLINNSSYTVANLPIASTSTSFLVPSAYE